MVGRNVGSVHNARRRRCGVAAGGRGTATMRAVRVGVGNWRSRDMVSDGGRVWN